jgi:hypothetical protein
MKARNTIVAAAILISTSAYGQTPKASSARDTYLITKHTSVFHKADDAKNDPWAVVSVGSQSVKHGCVLARREMSFRAYGPRNPMKIAQSKIRAARSSEVEFSLDEVEAVEMSDPERA